MPTRSGKGFNNFNYLFIFTSLEAKSGVYKFDLSVLMWHSQRRASHTSTYDNILDDRCQTRTLVLWNNRTATTHFNKVEIRLQTHGQSSQTSPCLTEIELRFPKLL